MWQRYREFCRIVGVELVVFVSFFVLRSLHVAIPCVFKFVTGIPCPGCGTTRAIEALLRGQIGLALWYNPVAIVVLVYLLALPWVALYDAWRQTSYLQKVARTPIRWYGVVLLVVVMLANWWWNIVKFL